ncbi:MAG: hypothetical protein WC795_00330 [Candidatus Paceibacterota bacterium]|jgi:hypothetical protein
MKTYEVPGVEYVKHIKFICTDGREIRPHRILRTKVFTLIRANGGIVDNTIQEDDPISITTKVEFRLPKGIKVEFPRE